MSAYRYTVYPESYFELYFHRLCLPRALKDSMTDYLRSIGLELSIVSGIFDLMHSTNDYLVPLENNSSVFNKDSSILRAVLMFKVELINGRHVITTMDIDNDFNEDFFNYELGEDVYDNFVFAPPLDPRYDQGDEAVIVYTLFQELVNNIVLSVVPFESLITDEMHAVMVEEHHLTKVILIKPLSRLELEALL